jgi:hypothetical protein
VRRLSLPRDHWSPSDPLIEAAHTEWVEMCREAIFPFMHSESLGPVPVAGIKYSIGDDREFPYEGNLRELPLLHPDPCLRLSKPLSFEGFSAVFEENNE